MSFYYLFIPTWFFTIIIYTLLAGQYGAKKEYPEAQAQEEAFDKKVENYQQKLADQEKEPIKDTTLFSKGLKFIGYIALGITLVLAVNVLLGSKDQSSYDINKQSFYTYGFICTITYFVASYWAMHRAKKMTH